MDINKISIIIPVYNVGHYIEQCLNSVCSQTYKNLEIICINDCSSDNSIDILRQYELKDNRIKVIDFKENKGVSAARNTGIKEAKGEYIGFVDSDDYIDAIYMEEMIKAAQKSGLDIVLNTNITIECEEKSEPLLWEKYPKAPVNGEILDSKKAVRDTHNMVWSHLYKRAFLDKYNLTFPQGCIHEDNYFNTVAKIYSGKIYAFEGPVYHYRKRKNSIMQERTDKAWNYLIIYNLIFDYCKEHNLLDKIEMKIFEPAMFIPVKNEKSYIKAKKLYSNLKKDIRCFANLYDDYELFIINSLLETKDFSEYIGKYNLDMRICYIKRKMNKK